MDASLLTQTSMDGGSKDNETTDEAVIACFVSSYCEEITLTVEETPLIELINSFFNSEPFIECAR